MELQEIFRQQVDRLRILISAMLVFIMQVGFMCLEAGLSPKREVEKVVTTIQQTTKQLNDDLTLLVIG